MIARNHKLIRKNPQKVMTFFPFKNKYNWYEINFPSEMDDWLHSEKVSSTTPLNILYKKEM